MSKKKIIALERHIRELELELRNEEAVRAYWYGECVNARARLAFVREQHEEQLVKLRAAADREIARLKDELSISESGAQMADDIVTMLLAIVMGETGD